MQRGVRVHREPRHDPRERPVDQPERTFLQHERSLLAGSQLAQREPAQRHRERLAAGIPRLPGQHREEHRQRDSALDRAFEQADDRAGDERARAELEATGRCAPYEKEYLTKTGERVPVLVGAARFNHEGGGSRAGVAFVLDQREQARLRQSRDRLLILPLILALVLGALFVLLRAVVAPLLLVATVLATYAASMGTWSS